MKCDRRIGNTCVLLQEIAANEDVLKFPSRHLAEYGEVMRALPGLLRVCKAYQKLLIHESWPDQDTTYEQEVAIRKNAENKLEELLG